MSCNGLLYIKVHYGVVWMTSVPPPTRWLGGAMVMGKLPVPGRPTIWMIVGQKPIALVVGAGWGCLDIFTLLYPFSPLSPSLWETARYRLKYCLKGLLNPKQPTNQPPPPLFMSKMPCNGLPTNIDQYCS